MFLTRDKPQQWRFFTGGYWTAWTTTTTSLASQWGLLINIDSATGDVAITSNNWIENERYGFAWRVSTTAWSLEFDSAVTRTWRLTLKVSNTDATWTTFASMGTGWGTTGTLTAGFWKYTIPVKASTKYRFRCFVKTNNVAAAAAFIQCSTYNAAGTRLTISTSNTLTWTNDWTLCQINFTSDATAAMLTTTYNNSIAWNISDAWFDINSMTLEEVIEPVANSLITPSPSLASFTAVGSTDNIDTSLDPTFVAVNTYTPPVAISETATNRQTFVPTKSKLTRIWIYPVAKGTWNWTVTVHNASNVVQAVITIANASLTNGVVTYFNVPANVTALASYHFHVTSTVADGTVRVWTASDLETCSYIQNYYKPTTNFKASQNNLSVSVNADEDGFLEAWKINLLTGQYTFDIRDVPQVWTWIGHIFNNTVVTWVGGLIFDVLSGTEYQLRTSATTYVEWVLKVKIPWGLTDITINAFLRRAGASFSTDGIGYTTMLDNTWSSTAVAMNYTIPWPVTTLFIKLFSNSGAGVTAYYANSANPFTITWTVSVSSYSVLKNYPTNKDIIKQYSTTLWAPTTSATYRATKWGFPAIEYSATEYQYLDVDTTATGSTVAFSELWITYTTVADGASLAISSTSTPNIFVKANITANRLYSSSNDYVASSDKDGSLRQTLTYQVVQ